VGRQLFSLVKETATGLSAAPAAVHVEGIVARPVVSEKDDGIRLAGHHRFGEKDPFQELLSLLVGQLHDKPRRHQRIVPPVHVLR